MKKLEIVYQKVGDLKPYDNNPRQNEDAVQYVANSIKEFGFKVPIIVDKDNVIVAGHTRLLAAIDLGIEEVPTISADDLTEDQIKAFRIADNKVSDFSLWDYDKLDLELENIDLDMTQFGIMDQDINWGDVEDLTDETYKEPESNKLQCPICNGIDYAIHFKKVKSEDIEDEDIS